MEEKIRQSKALKIIDIVAVTVIAFIINLIWSAIVAIGYSVAFAFRGGNLNNPGSFMEAMLSDPSFLMFTSMYNLIAIVVVVVFWRFADKQPARRLGYARSKNTIWQLLLGLLGAAAAIGVVIVFGSISHVISFQSMGTASFAPSQIVTACIVGILTFLMVGFGEETVYRAYIQNHLVDLVGSRYGLVLSALIFAGAHLFTYGKILDLIDVFLAGIILGYAFMLTKSIYLPAAFHFLWDYLQLSIFRIQNYDYYKGPVLLIFNNAGDLVINNYNLGNKLEVVFIIVEIMLLLSMHTYRKRIAKLKTE